MGIKDTMQLLCDADRKLLFAAFSNGITEMIKLPNNRFIGVNIVSNSKIIIEEEMNHWSQGRLDV